MRIRLKSGIGILAFFITSAVLAAPIEIQFEEKNFESKAPESCELTRIGMEVFKEPQFEANKRKGLITLMAGFYETNRPGCMEEFGFVQWIKGCQVHTRYNSQTKELTHYLGSREHYGKSVSFVHPEWVVDTIDSDPLYGSSEDYLSDHPELKRHSFHYVFEKPLGSSADHTSLLIDHAIMNRLGSGKDFVFRQNPGSPTFKSTQWAIRDIPSSGSLLWEPSNPNIYPASETSLEFKLCIYRTHDIPRTGSPARFDIPSEIGGPIDCLDWNVKEGFSPETLQMGPKTEHPVFCGIQP